MRNGSTAGIRGMLTASLLCACIGCNGSSSEEQGGTNAGGEVSSAGAAGTAGAMAGAVADSGGCGGGCGIVVDGTTGAFVVTSAEGSYWEPGQVTEVTGAEADVTVDDAAKAQTWDGFGGCFTELGWIYLSDLSEAERDRAIQLLFGSDGARFAWGRIPIGGNDYVSSRYTLDDTGEDLAPDSTESNRPPPDLTLSEFSVDRDLQNLIPYIQAAQAVKPDLRFWANPWTPPVWMKTGYLELEADAPTDSVPSYYDGGTMKDDPETLTAHAQYFVKFVQAYADQGIDVEFVAPQNEPGYEMHYPSCRWDATNYADFVGLYLGPALRDADLDTRVMLGSLDSGDDIDIVEAVLAHSTASDYCAVAGLGYDMVSPSKVSALHSAEIPVWVSEHRAGNYPWEAGYQATAPNDLAYAIETWGLIRDAITEVRVTAYNAWNMVLDEGGKSVSTASEWAQNALLVADSGRLSATPAYYVFRHFSQYVEPGAQVVGTDGGDAVAFENPDGSLVVVLFNAGEAKTMTVAIDDKTLRFSAPRQGFATLVLPQGPDPK